MLDADLSVRIRTQALARLSRPDAGRWLSQVERVRHCAHPVRLAGRAETINTVTGEVHAAYNTATEPDGVAYVRCGNRRASVCPSCSFEYKGDVYHLLIAGAAGGIKGVPETVASHPLVFATLTAPGFGLVHAAKKPGRPGTRRCRPRTGGGRKLCPHGRSTWCMAVHDHTDPQVGQPLCRDCYDYAGQLVWQWWAPELWRRFTITLRRRLAAYLGLSEHAARQWIRVQFAKVAEFQSRGVVHFHALIRLDGPPSDTDAYPGPGVSCDSAALAELVRAAAAAVRFTAPQVDSRDVRRQLRFGPQADARPISSAADPTAHGGQLHPTTVAGYVAKYATKAAADLPTDQATGSGHLRRLRATLHDLAGRVLIGELADSEHPYRGWRRWSEMLGFRGHLATKSRRYSVTLGQLRRARRDWSRRRQQHPDPLGQQTAASDHDQDDEDSTLVIGSWRFVGIGWLTSGDAALAAASAARARDD